MTAQPQSVQSALASQEAYEKKLKQWWVFMAIVYAPFIAIFGPPASAVALYINYKRWHEYSLKQLWKKPLPQMFIGVLSGVWLIFAGLSFSMANGEPTTLHLAVILWVLVVPLSPVIASIFRQINRVLRIFKPITLDEQVAQWQKKKDQQEAKDSQHAGRIANAGDPVRGYLHLGAFIKGDTFPSRLGVVNKRNHVYLEDRLIREHMIIIGTTGAGKTETLKNLVKEILWSSDRDVFVVDGKGEAGFAEDLANLIYSARGTAVPIFKLGQTTQGTVYHGFRGQPTDIYNRLCALIGVDEITTGEGAYYADINRDLLQLICYAPIGAPQSFEEVRERLNRKWLEEAYKDHQIELETIKELDPKILNGLLVRVRPLVREFAPIVDPQGFILEDSRGAIFSLRTQSVGDSARRFLKFLVEDFKDFVGKRQKRPAVFIIDEFGAFGNNNITALLSLARSSDLGVILATQDAVTLGDESTKRKILANTRTKMLMVTEYPEELATLAGTIYAIEASIQHNEGDPTGVGSARIQHQFKIDMNEAAKLEPGEAFLIRQRTALKLKGPRVGTVLHEPGAIADMRKPVRTQKEPEPQAVYQQEPEDTTKPII